MTHNVLTPGDIKKLADLARLSLTDEEVKKYTKQLDESLSYVDNLNELSAKKLTGNVNVARLESVSRDDVSSEDRVLKVTEVFANAPNKKNNYFIVNRILT